MRRRGSLFAPVTLLLLLACGGSESFTSEDSFSGLEIFLQLVKVE